MKFITNNKTLSFFSCFLLGVLSLFYSCTKVININLNSASPQTVIQANINNQPAPYTVQISQTVNFSQPNVFPPVTGALVILSDNAGNTDTLKSSAIPGTYTGQKLTGTPGRSYSLSITAGGKNYSAVSTMPSPVNIDTLTYQLGPFGGKEINVQFKDLAGVANYYHFVEFINHIQQKQVFVTDDELQDGQTIVFPLRNSSDSLKAGDSVIVQLQDIDKNVYNYYNSIMDASGSGNVSPANPPSNISNGALGYFSAYAVTSKTIVIP